MPVRIAFVGQSVFFRQCALEQAADGLQPSFVDFRQGAASARLLSELEQIDPDVVLVFRPEIVPEGLFASLDALTIGYLTEPLPRSGARTHHDLHARLKWLEEVDRGNFDRIVSFDPLIAEAAERVLPVWRSLPIPVADSLFMDVRPPSDPPRMLFVGRSTEHREELLAPLKQAYPIVHIGHGLFGEQLALMLASADVQINLHNNPYPTFENRVSIALAAGHLVISEPLSPSHGLRPGVDFLEVKTPAQLLSLVQRIHAEPSAFSEVQAAGRRAAEAFRASLTYPQLIRDALADVASSGGRARRTRDTTP